MEPVSRGLATIGLKVYGAEFLVITNFDDREKKGSEAVVHTPIQDFDKIISRHPDTKIYP